MSHSLKKPAVFFISIFAWGCFTNCFSQVKPTTDSSYIIIVAGKQYATNEKHRERWGEHYRQEWNTPVKVRIAMLDTLAGGLTPYQAGGGRQSKTLRLKDKNDREYVLRSIDKSFGKALPEIAQGTFIEAIANDQVSIAHPYAAITIPPLIEPTGIYHTNPQILFIPKQERLGQFNDEFGDMLFLFEQRPDENWASAANFGNAENIIGTEKLFEKLFGDNNKRVDQMAYARARLFDMLVGDWGRHEDQWRWAEFKTGNQVIYKPIPRDRDQVYTKFDGNMITLLFSLGGLDHLQTFDYTIKDVKTFNFPARNLDRLVANEVTPQQWSAIATDLQTRITDSVIINAVRQQPPETFGISGEEIIGKLKARRDKLPEYALEYARSLALEADIPGSNGVECFEVTRDDDGTTVNIFRTGKGGSANQQPFFSRKYSSGETKEIRLYGLDGDDVFRITGKANDAMLVRIVPGAGHDSVSDLSRISVAKKTIKLYDNERPDLVQSGETKLKLTDDTTLTTYKYAHFQHDKKGFVFRPGLTIGVGYQIQRHKWRKDPFGYEHRWMGYYGPNRGSVAFEYRFDINRLVGKWNLGVIGRIDWPLVANYFGTGNESEMGETVNRKYYRVRSRGFNAGFELNRLYDSAHLITIRSAFQTVKLLNDEERFIASDKSGIGTSSLNRKYFIASGISYGFKKSDHPVVPSRGFAFNLSAVYIHNLQEAGSNVGQYASSISFYLPFLRRFSLAMRVGGMAVTGNPEFYQLAILSGKENMRGFRRQRYYGHTSFYSNHEIRWMIDARNRLFNGKIGLLAFLDKGRVWQPGERSDTWHIGYGGGFFVAPFNKILLNASYGISADDRVIHMRIGFLF